MKPIAAGDSSPLTSANNASARTMNFVAARAYSTCACGQKDSENTATDARSPCASAARHRWFLQPDTALRLRYAVSCAKRRKS